MSAKPFSVRFLFLAALLLLTGCGPGGKKAVTDAYPVISPPRVLEPEAPGDKTLGIPPLILDISHTEYGYFTAIADDAKINIQMIGPDEVTYSYFLEPGEQAVIPFTSGDGDYCITCYQQAGGSQYAALYMETIPVTLENEFWPFLYPNQYVNFSAESEASKLALSMADEEASDLDILNSVYDYVTSHIVYDEEKAATVEAGYLPDVDETLETGKGICFDYAALMTAMLRSCNIPCKLQIGYSSDIKHAWIDVYMQDKGWVDKAIAFDGNTWSRMDPTFDSGSDDKESIRDYIGDGSNYTVQFTR